LRRKLEDGLACLALQRQPHLQVWVGLVGCSPAHWGR
jgi:hypothetical protein